MRTATLVAVAGAFAAAASAEVRSSSSYSIRKEVLSGGGGVTTTVPGSACFSSFAQPQTGQMQATLTARLGFLAGGGRPPEPPQNLAATPGNGHVTLDWDDNAEPNLTGYNVYRSETQGGPYSQLNAALVTASDYADGSVTNETTYYYVVRAVDDGFRESVNSNEAQATPSLQAGLKPGVLGGGGCGQAGAAAVLIMLGAAALARRKSL